MQRIAHPDEIAKYIFFISSENNSYVTGNILLSLVENKIVKIVDKFNQY